MTSNYDKWPSIDSGLDNTHCSQGWDSVANHVASALPAADCVLCVDCYPGVDHQLIAKQLTSRLDFSTVLFSDIALLSETELRERFDRDLTDDPVFGRLSGASLTEFFNPEGLSRERQRIATLRGRLLVVGVGAALIVPSPTLLIYADMPRWELQQRQRAGEIANLGLNNQSERPALKYKRAFFLDWRAADRHKQTLLRRADLFLDTTSSEPKMLNGDIYRQGAKQAVQRPFRVVPFFDPGPWGGHWMQTVCDLPADVPNYAWCFDCVPEENSLVLRFGDRTFETPAINLVFLFPRELLGDSVHARFGKEFPIRFDLLDTMGGGNLSLQVHPLTEYIQQRFGMPYTQDESYYMLDAEPDARVWLGLREDIQPSAMQRDLETAQTGTCAFSAERHVHSLPARKHDHFLIPAGTVHCSGSGSMVLEISATPYIFTFKMWDWERLGLDGRPRPIHLEHAMANIQWDRTSTWVNQQLAGPPVTIATGHDWHEERTGLHGREFIETRRHWFTGTVSHDTLGTVNVLNLVEGREVIVESPTEAFAPFTVHYAETFIVPASVGHYTIRTCGESSGKRCATLKAYVRDGSEPLRWP